MFWVVAQSELSNIPQNFAHKGNHMLAVVLKYLDPHLSKRLQGRERGPVHSIVASGNLGKPVTSGEQRVQE